MAISLPRFRLRLSKPTLFLLVLLLLATSLIFISHDHDHPRSRSVAAPDLTAANPQGKSGWLGGFWGSQVVETGLEFRDDGLVYGLEGLQGKQREKHPIEVLMQRGKERWEALLDRQSRTLPQAVIEYKRRYGRNPPKGFEAWWQFTKKNGVKIVDDYDQINYDIEPFLALSPAEFRKRADALMETPHKYEIFLSKDGVSTLTGARAGSARGKLLFSLLESLAPLLPSDVTMHISDHDLGSWILGDDQRQLLVNAARTGRTVDPAEIKPLENKQRDVIKTLESACPKDSPAYLAALEAGGDSDKLLEQANAALAPHPPTFIHDHRPLYDFCSNPSLIWIHGAFGWHQTRDTILRPIFQLSKNVLNAEILTTPLEAYENATSASARKKYTPWEEKTINKLFWRGSSTGDSYSIHKDYDWHRSHRPRLHLWAQREDGESTVWVKRGKEWAPESWSHKRLNEQYLDVGLAGKPHQCKKEDGTCDQMAAEMKEKDRVQPEVAKNYKYVFDIDGNGWSSRLHRLMTSGSVVVKSTIYPEWHSDWMTPWVHYIPSQMDYSDIYPIMAFFAGSPDGRTRGNDDLAEQIAEQGKQFAEEHWRWEDMQAYMLRLLLEYARLQADDREAFSYNKSY